MVNFNRTSGTPLTFEGTIRIQTIGGETGRPISPMRHSSDHSTISSEASDSSREEESKEEMGRPISPMRSHSNYSYTSESSGSPSSTPRSMSPIHSNASSPYKPRLDRVYPASSPLFSSIGKTYEKGTQFLLPRALDLSDSQCSSTSVESCSPPDSPLPEKSIQNVEDLRDHLEKQPFMLSTPFGHKGNIITQINLADWFDVYNQQSITSLAADRLFPEKGEYTGEYNGEYMVAALLVEETPLKKQAKTVETAVSKTINDKHDKNLDVEWLDASCFLRDFVFENRTKIPNRNQKIVAASIYSIAVESRTLEHWGTVTLGEGRTPEVIKAERQLLSFVYATSILPDDGDQVHAPDTAGDCQVQTGMGFESGEGIFHGRKDARKAFYWYQRAIENHHYFAYSMLDHMYLQAAIPETQSVADPYLEGFKCAQLALTYAEKRRPQLELMLQNQVAAANYLKVPAARQHLSSSSELSLSQVDESLDNILVDQLNALASLDRHIIEILDRLGTYYKSPKLEGKGQDLRKALECFQKSYEKAKTLAHLDPKDMNLRTKAKNLIIRLYDFIRTLLISLITKLSWKKQTGDDSLRKTKDAYLDSLKIASDLLSIFLKLPEITTRSPGEVRQLMSMIIPLVDELFLAVQEEMKKEGSKDLASAQVILTEILEISSKVYKFDRSDDSKAKYDAILKTSLEVGRIIIQGKKIPAAAVTASPQQAN